MMDGINMGGMGGMGGMGMYQQGPPTTRQEDMGEYDDGSVQQGQYPAHAGQYYTPGHSYPGYQ